MGYRHIAGPRNYTSDLSYAMVPLSQMPRPSRKKTQRHLLFIFPVQTYLTWPVPHVPRNTLGPHPETATEPNHTKKFKTACRPHTTVDLTPVPGEEPPLPREEAPTSPSTYRRYQGARVPPPDLNRENIAKIPPPLRGDSRP